MIKLTQLRLHNTVEHQGTTWSHRAISEESVTLQYENGNISAALNDEEIAGIDLTSWRLEQSGFVYTRETDAYQFVVNEDAVLTVNPHIAGGYSISICVKGHWCGRPVKTLHELQNIYLDLTGNELAID